MTPSEIAQRLLTPSVRYEPAQRGNATGFEPLQSMQSLNAVVRASLPLITKTPAVAAPIMTQALPPQVTPRYETGRPEYKAALKDQSLLQALLSLQKNQSGMPSSRILKPQASTRPQSPKGFQPATHRSVDAEIKRLDAFSQAAGLGQPILRPGST